jgi:hypothetical protein
LIPYHNPYKGKLNNLTTKFYDDTYNNAYNDENNICNDDQYESDDEPYDIDEVFGNRNESIEGLNPGFNPTKILSSIDRNNVILPCYAELQGKCPSPSNCKFSHDVKLLQKTWSEKQEELNRSRYRPAMGQLPKNNTPLTPLRSITTEEGGQVSIPTNNNSNEMNHHLDRNPTASFADQQPKSTPELYKGRVTGDNASCRRQGTQ